jgi:hypothetical protein
MAEGIVTAMESDLFEHYVPDMRAFVEAKTSDPDTMLAGMAAMLRQGGVSIDPTGGERGG